jgi:acetyl-CoA/propionyl-CoA carboxylase biotin carboxyl carrier protein
VQVLGDAYGNVVHLFERECSLQRRFQKIVEETPSPALDIATRRRICDTAAGIARAAGYRNAGTIEFIFGQGDAAGGEPEFYFLEMNTRLQVEHPVTEAVTGVDLVAAQMRIASGHTLWFAQEDVVCRGHAIELRIYAEDSTRDFAPATGRVLAYAPPVGGGVRVDSGVRQGQEVTAAFDPMLAKLIVHADTRAAALDLATDALRDFVLLGCRNNIGFLMRLIADRDVRAGRLHTGLIADKPELAAPAAPDVNTLARVLAIAALSTRAVTDAADAVPTLHGAIGDWRN